MVEVKSSTAVSKYKNHIKLKASLNKYILYANMIDMVALYFTPLNAS